MCSALRYQLRPSLNEDHRLTKATKYQSSTVVPIVNLLLRPFKEEEDVQQFYELFMRTIDGCSEQVKGGCLRPEHLIDFLEVLSTKAKPAAKKPTTTDNIKPVYEHQAHQQTPSGAVRISAPSPIATTTTNDADAEECVTPIKSPLRPLRWRLDSSQDLTTMIIVVKNGLTKRRPRKQKTENRLN
eukprot:GHVH01009801.1.p1 GENE.GHVH01009801.1~~GHVH01009801.1.p1  ORF type:complete len:185 (-),score=16.98 GHVH01009801.1:915-1469(-)